METSTLFIALVFVMAGLVKGATGMGLPTVAVALLTLRMAPLEAAALLILPSAVTNAWQLASGPALYPLWLRMRGLLLAVCAGTALGGWLMALATAPVFVRAPALAVPLASALLGAALCGYALLGISGWRGRLPPAAERWAGPLAGAATGVMAAVTGVFVMPIAPYLQALDLERDDLVQALGLAFTVSTVALAAMLAWRGEWHAAAAGASLLALPPAAAGMVLGQWLRRRMPLPLFRRCFFASLLALGAHQCYRAAAPILTATTLTATTPTATA